MTNVKPYTHKHVLFDKFLSVFIHNYTFFIILHNISLFLKA